MARIERFEDIEAWQKARELAREIYAFSNTGPFAKDFGLRDQTQRSRKSSAGESERIHMGAKEGRRTIGQGIRR